MSNFLNDCAPSTFNWKSEFLVSLALGTFVALFLIVFQPYGTYEFVSDTKLLFLVGYGLILMLVYFMGKLLSMPLIRLLSNFNRWTIGVNLLVTCQILLLTSVIWYLYWGWYFASPIYFLGWLRFVALTLTVIIFPVAALLTATYVQWLRKQANSEEPRENRDILRAKTNKVTLQGSDGSSELTLAFNEILYFRAARNYVEVFFLEDDKVKQNLIRGSLKFITDQLPNGMVLQCHRSFLINPEQVKKVTKNNRGAHLHFDVPAPKVPVSRANRSILQHLGN